MKIWIFFHGPIEQDYPEAHEIMRMQEEAQKQKDVSIRVMNPEAIDLMVDSNGEWKALYEGRILDEMPDVIIPRTGTETGYTGYSVMRFYERLGVPFLNSPAVVDMVADKLHTLQVLAAADIPVPRTMLGKFPPDLDLIEKNLGFPIVIKTLKGTRGGGVFLSESRDQFKDLVDLLAEANAGAHIIFQKYVQQSHGRDLRVFVVEGKVLGVMERQSGNTSFKSNISRGGQGKAHAITPEIEKLALAVAQALRLEVAGIDLLFDERGFTVCEANSSPGFTGLEPSCNINAAGAILKAAMHKVRKNPVGNILQWMGFKTKRKHQATFDTVKAA
ncbi:MAG: RimK family alpha-L-glutamate ligase [Alphaproteobacteria bacterium]|nr:RimK family alpha-L-glutamate ligase [Alphaproteobacteria bacterium]